MKNPAVAAACLGGWLLFLLVERIMLDRRRRRIPVRVAVTGTRGKSTVTRFVAAALRESGFRVLAKTTGSRPVLILPDGTEREIARRGPATILEQKKLVRLAARLGANALVAEMMSIRSECLSAESERILGPGVLILTNARLDHVEAMGKTREEVAACLASAFPPNGTVILPEEELGPVFAERAAVRGVRIVAARRDEGLPVPEGEFEVNVRLAVAAARALGADEAAALRGVASARPDFGSLKVRDVRRGGAGPDIVFVSAFAANDPESTALVLEKAFTDPVVRGRRAIGLLNLRADRGDRTLQWAEALEAGGFARFDTLALAGSPSRALAFRLRRRSGWKGQRLVVLREKIPVRVFAELAAVAGGPAVVVGLGNIGGLGADLVAALDDMEARA